MHLWIPVNVYTIGLMLTLLSWVWYWRAGSASRGDYDFGPAIYGMTLLIGTGAFWLAVLLARFIR